MDNVRRKRENTAWSGSGWDNGRTDDAARPLSKSCRGD